MLADEEGEFSSRGLFDTKVTFLREGSRNEKYRRKEKYSWVHGIFVKYRCYAI